MAQLKLKLNEASIVSNYTGSDTKGNTNAVIEDLDYTKSPDYQIIDITVLPDNDYFPTIQSILISLDEDHKLCENESLSSKLDINILSETVNQKTGYSNSLFEFESRDKTITLSLVLQESERKGIYKVEAYTTKGEKVFETNTFRPKEVIGKYLNSLAEEYLKEANLKESRTLKEHNDVTLIRVSDANRRNVPSEVNNILKSFCDSKNIDMSNIYDIYFEMIEDYPMDDLGNIYAAIWSPDAGLTNCYKFSSYNPDKPTYLGTAEEKDLKSRVKDLSDFDYIAESEKAEPKFHEGDRVTHRGQDGYTTVLEVKYDAKYNVYDYLIRGDEGNIWTDESNLELYNPSKDTLNEDEYVPESFYDNEEAERLADEIIENKIGIDYSEWNNLTKQEERNALVRPKLKEWYAKHHLEFDQDPTLFTDVLDWLDEENFHTEATMLLDINSNKEED